MLTLNRLLLKRGYSIINNLNILALIISVSARRSRPLSYTPVKAIMLSEFTTKEIKDRMQYWQP
jgi:hypothetical protein